MTTRVPIAMAALALLAACETAPMKEFTSDAKSAWSQLTGSSSQGGAALAAGLKQYDDGDYPQSQKSRNGPCREEFRKALAIDPSMDLAPAEAGHPAWGPTFRSLKAGR